MVEGRENDSRWTAVGGGEADKRGCPIRGRKLPGTKKGTNLQWRRPRIPEWNYLRPCAHQTHAERPRKHQHARDHPSAAAQYPPALVAQKVLREQLDQRGENQQPSRNGVHGSD